MNLALSSLVVVPAAPRQWREFLGDVVAVRVAGDATPSAYTLLDVHTPAGGGIPVLHAHPGAETVIVLTGDYEFYRRERGATVAVAAPAGTVAYVPSGAPHGYANVGDGPGHLLLLAEAPGQLDAFFTAVGTPVDGPEAAAPAFPDVAAWLHAMATYRFTFVEAPPPGEGGSWGGE